MDVLAGGNEAAKLAFPGVTPNPVRGAEGRFEFVMQEPGPVKLALYDMRDAWRAPSPTVRSGAGDSRWRGMDAATTAACSGPGSTGRDSGAAGHTFSMRMVVVEQRDQ